MATTKNYLAFDLGAESGRAILGEVGDAQLTLTDVHRFPNIPVAVPEGPRGSTLHWNVLQLWSDIKQGLSLTAQRHGNPVSVGLDTWGVDFALLDRNGVLMGNPVHYRDDRTDGVMGAAFAKVDRAEVFEQTGIQFMQFNSLYQLLSLVQDGSPLLENAATFLTVPDLFNYWLTGRAACEFSNATTTQCYDPRRGGWAEPLLDALEIPTAIFPEIITPGTVLGTLREQVADELGIQPLTVVAPACHDTGSAVAAVPAANGENFAWISSGTWSILGVEAPQPVINEEALASNLTNEGGVNGTFRLSKNVMGMWPVQECLRTWAREGSVYSYAELTEMAATAPALRSIIDPDHDDFLKPGDMPARIRDFCARTGQPVPDDYGAIVRCVLESLALKYRYVLEALESLLGHRLEPLYIVGGGSQNKLLNGFTADATGRTVVAGPVEATATGNVIVQAIASGQLGSLADGRTLVRNSFEMHTHEPSNSAAWDDAYGRLLGYVQH